MPACRGVSDPTGGLSHTNVLSEGLPMVLKARLPGQELQSVRNIHDCTRLPCEGMLNAHGSEGPCSVALRWRDSREPFFNCRRTRSPMQGIFSLFIGAEHLQVHEHLPCIAAKWHVSNV